jgi:hypothetical protein
MAIALIFHVEKWRFKEYGSGGRGRGWEQEGEMTQALYE